MKVGIPQCRKGLGYHRIAIQIQHAPNLSRQEPPDKQARHGADVKAADYPDG